MAIQFKRGSSAKRIQSTDKLKAGQPFFEKDTGKVYVGDGETELKNLRATDNNAIPIKQFTSGPFQIPQVGYNKEIYWIDSNSSISANSLVQRDQNGIIYINPPDAVPENINEYAGVNVQYANKTYVKAINVTENTYVYAASSEGPNGKLRISADTTDGSTIVQRSSTGTIITADPVQDQEAVTKKYVDGNFVKPNTNVKFSDVIVGAYPDGEYAQYSTSRINIGDYGQVFQFAFPINQVPTDQVNDILTSGNVKTINGNSIVGSGDITISGGGDVTLAGNNTFTGTNKFTSNTLEVNDGKDKVSENGKAAIFSASSMKLYDGSAGRNYTINFPAYSSTLSGSATLVTNFDLASKGYIKPSDNNIFTGSNAFNQNLSIYGLTTSGMATNGLQFQSTRGSTYCFYLGNRWITDTGKLINLPAAAGTLALTSDIKIKSASLDGTTLTLTI